MKKLFLLIPAMLLALAMNAKEIQISSATSNIIHITIAASTTADGDVLVLEDVGPYVNHYATENGDDYTKLAKNITIKAADGLESKPVIKFEVPFQGRNGKSAKFIGIKFDGASLTAYDNYFHFNDAYDNSLEFEDCEFTGVSKYLFYVSSGKKAHSIAFDNCSIHDNSNRIVYNRATIDNLSFVDSEISGSSHYIIHNNSAQIGTCAITDCDIHGCAKRAILNEAGTINNVEISNTKFYSFTGETIIDNYDIDATIGKLKINGSEFYSNSVDLISTSSGSHADSCIITDCLLHDNTHRAMLQQGTINALNIKGGKIYNFTAYSVFENYSTATLGNIKIDGTEFYGNAKDIIIGSTATSHADSCILNNCYFHNNSRSAVYFEKSSVSGVETCDGVIIKNSTFANNDLSGSSRSVIDVFNYGETATANIEVTVDHCTFYNNTTVNYDYSCIRVRKSTKVNITNSIFAYPSAIEFYATNCYGGTISNTLVYNLNKGHRSDNGAPALTNTTTVNPRFNDLANNNYTFDANWSTGSISPAWKSATDGTSLGDPRWYRDNEVIPSSSIASSYDLLSTKAQLTGDVELNASDHIKYKGTTTPGTAKWKLHVDRACMINAVVDRESESTSGCQLTLTVKDAEGNTVGTLAATSGSYSDADINLPGTITFSQAGDYTFILTNSTANSGAILEKITLSYIGGAVQTIATDANTTLNVADAWFTSGATRADGQISYSSWKSDDSWIKWNIATSETKFYDLTLNFSSDNAHSMAVNIYEDEAASPVATVSESYTSTTGSLTLTDRVNLVGGKNYIVKVTNPTGGSHAKVTSVVFAPVAATSTALPNTLAFSNAVLSDKARIIDGMLYFNEIGDTDPRGQWAQWEVTTDHNGLFLFTMGVTSTNEQTYKITIKDGSDNVLDYYETSPGSGTKTLTHYFALNSGTYFVKVENTRSYSKGHLTSLVVTEPAGIVTIDENATSIDSWKLKYNDGNSYDVQINRTIVAGMYNTICLPFEVTSAQAKDIFGADVQLRTLESATLEEEGQVLNLSFTKTSGMYPGTPHLIKTSRDIVNPVFVGVQFAVNAPATSTGTNANFKGNFIAGTIPVSENNLFLGANNKLFFPTVEMPILGMRAYFIIHDTSSNAILRARIVEGGQVATEIDLVSQEPKVNSQKLIINGQLVIIRDGVRYNVMGVKLQ